ncbi:alpha/beta hydrolase family esterase [Solimonas marina]|uniref:Dienelactone hydrolase domain-containing protein n=1 Tax=Solimonas marina TaxID=2714601 RepID=A0A969WB64_9GAMM|nr:PHB depolymerase family esterase [Solimonas marina]NKF22261.1 hypothetical protein [Solimonas marina]
MRLSIVSCVVLCASLFMSLPARAATTVSGFVGEYTGSIGDLTVSDTKTASKWTANSLVYINSHWLTLARGTAAFDISFSHDDTTRHFLVIRPQTSSSGAAAFMMLPGTGATSEGQANMTSISANVATSGFWAIVPEADGSDWNDDPGYSNGIDDVGFLAKVVDILTGYLNLDAKRVYISGMSNGGFMAERVACELSDRIAATAVVAGTVSSNLAKVCSPASPRPILFIAGTADPIVPYDGSRIGVESAPSAYALWETLHNCTASATTTTDLPDTADDGTTTTLSDNTGCGSGGEVRLYTVNNGGHTWPGGSQYLSESLIGKTSQDFSANSEIWSFFSAHPMP